MSDVTGGEGPPEEAGAHLGETEATEATEAYQGGAYARQVPADGGEPGPLTGGPGDGGFGGPPMGHAEPSRPKGLIAAVIILTILLLASLGVIGVLLATRKSTPATTSSAATTTTLPSPTASPTPSSSASPSPTKSASPLPTGTNSPRNAAEKLYAARKANSKTQAKAVATATAIDQIFAKPAGSYSMNGCESSPDDPANPNVAACTFTQPGGQMSMFIEAQGGKWMVTKVVYQPVATST